MYLKRLEIFGFKSFAEKIRLEFEPGTTAIVGPNGCGKTNLADAIKWVLGEQSMRSLRCNRMEDLIFNGSQSRPALSFAEVSLTVDNQDGLLPVNYTEVTVSRRLYRSGESEYYLNKTQCRLRDIRDLFLDTGLGAQSYSLMEQGKVEFILQAKPEERRSLFEEAAGIAKYKARKEEALSRLEKVEFDLLRLNDALALLREQIRSVESAARKARQYQKYQEELKTLEIIDFLEQLQNLEKEIENLTQGNKQVIQDWETSTTLIHNLETNFAELRDTSSKKKEEIERIQNALHELETNSIRSENRIILAEEKIKDSNTQKENLAAENIKNQELLHNLQENIKRVTQENDALKNTLAGVETQLKTKEKEQGEIDKKIKHLTRSLDDTKSKIYKVVQEKIQTKNDIIRLQTQDNALEAQKKQSNQELLSLEERKNKISDDLKILTDKLATQNKEVNELKDKKTQLENILTQKRNTYHNLIEQLQKLREQCAQLQTRLSSLKEFAERQKISLSAIDTVLSLNLPGIYGPLHNLLKISQQYEKLIEQILGDKLNFLVSETIDTAKRAIQYLKENNKGWVGFFVLEKIPHRLTSLSKFPKTRNFLELITYQEQFAPLMQFLFHNVYSEGTTIYSEAIIQGGSQIQTSGGPLTQREEIRNTEENLKKTEHLLAETNRNKEIAEKEIIDTENELNKVNLLLQENQILHTEILKENERKDDELKLALEEIKVITREINQTDKEILQMRQQIQEKDNLLQTYEVEEENLQNEIKTLENSLSAIKEEKDKSLQELNQLKITFSTEQQRYEILSREEEKTLTEEKNLHQVIQEKKDRISSLEKIVAIEEEIRVKEKENIDRYQQNRVELKKMFVQLKDECGGLDKQTSSVEEKLATLKQNFGLTQEKKKDLELNLQRINLERKHIELTLKEEFSLTPDEAKEKYSAEKQQLPPGISESAEERKFHIERLKKRIESFGAVNLTAPEEYEQLQARLNFLISQEEDLKKAREDLHQLINKINISTRETFQKTFKQIRENFRQTFRTLFEGGEADIILTDETNLWETGIDIVAQPPGKKLQNISLLSGGEKALTAIALLFAFFLVKPAPFCLLDEVDAALDDANIQRYINLLRDFVQRTQFVIITHNKRTIETADLLYGVTMEEFGVSKIISVKFQKIQPAVV